ncbi:hypothetical protein JNB71_24105 [Rhizobium herbae]|uniref:Uncharacterized protein n=1 Tax=Rhizobium herbae TaxID=508661 RepID=A0ABS7HH25_9HYPH|nr:hypothetical protein [Rhizobium herbae]MBW9066393.1 hypothetical protein [Rhizobium herbae]
MRPITLSNATKVLVAVLALVVWFTDFAAARDRHDAERHFVRRHHERRGDRDVLSGVNVDSRLLRRHHGRRDRAVLSGINVDSRLLRRHRHVRLAGINADRRYFEHRYGFHRRPGQWSVVREYPDQRVNYWQSAYGGDDFPSQALGGTYFGGLSAWSDAGNGTYFNSEGGGYGYFNGATDSDYRAPRAKIIRVTPSTAGRACSWEAGVCVIRR